MWAGSDDGLVVGLQLTHSGRYSCPNVKGRPEPRVAQRHPILDRRVGVDSDAAVLSDGELRRLIEASLPRHQWPRGIIVVRDLPRTDTGKLQRFRLRDQVLQDRVLQNHIPNHIQRGDNES